MRLGITLSHFEYEYAQRQIEGIRKYVEDTGDNFLIFSTEEPESDESEFAYQEWAVSKFFNRSNLDGIIVPTATLSRFVTEKKAVEIVKKLNEELPVFSIVSKVEGIPSLVIDSEKAYKHMVEHLIVEHGCKKILMFAIDAESEDIRQRLTFFKEVMEEHGLEVPEDHILYGQYTVESAVEVLQKKFPTRESVDFDAIVCAIDELAMGAIKYLTELGLSVPEDVCVTGFDNTLRSIYSYPSLSTIDQNIPLQTYGGAKFLADMIQGGNVEPLNTITSTCCLRESCGCLEQGSKYVSRLADGQLIPKDRDFFSTAYNAFFVHGMQNIRILDFIDELHSGLSLDALSRRLDRYMNCFNIKKSAICLYRTPVEVFRHDDFNLPDEARIYYASDDEHGLKIIDSRNYFDCSKSLLPDGHLDFYDGINIVRVLYHGRVQYGYMILSIGSYGTTEYMMIYSLLAKFIASAYEVTTLAEKNKKLSILSKTDELTGLLNRRGFMLMAQQELNLAADIGKSGLVIYGDIDGLKKINDTYGHAAGDRAIVAELELIKRTFRVADTIGRLGGDEFAIISISLSLEVFENLKKRLEDLCDEWNRTSKEPFKISISLGAAVFDSQNFNLENLLKQADEEQYKVKNAKKAKNVTSS